MEVLNLSNIEYAYSRKPVLRDLSLNIKNERLLLIGSNGAGKSTLLKVISGLFVPQKGQMTYLGQDLKPLSIYQRVNLGISYLAQTDNIVPGLSVLDNLFMAAYGLSKDELHDRSESILSVFSFLKNKTNRRSGNLSGGERQALAISMVLMKQPGFLLLDEPSAGLSPKAAQNILSHLEEIQERFSIKAICMVEHKLKLALSWADRVAILSQGTVTHAEEQPQTYLANPEKLERYFF